MFRPHPVSCLYSAQAFDFISSDPLVVAGNIDWDDADPIITILPKKNDAIGTIEIGVPRDYSTSDIPLKLFLNSKRSAVGKGSTTVLDESVRKSKEISAKRIRLSRKFKKWVDVAVSDGAVELHHPYPVVARPYKLLIYGKGGKFKSHIDSPHSEGMIMTFSVDIWCGGRQGGSLQFEPRTKAENFEIPNKGEITHHLFYHDIIHRLTPIQSGWKLSLVFDVCQAPISAMIYKDITGSEHTEIGVVSNIRNDYRKLYHAFLKGCKYLKSINVKRVGFPLRHTYMCSDDMELNLSMTLPDHLQTDVADLIMYYVNFIVLKGMDKVIGMIAEELNPNPRIIKICSDGENFIYDERLLNVFKLDEAFDMVHYQNEDEECGDVESDDEHELYKNEADWKRGETLKSGSKFIPRMDRYNEFEILSDDCLLGDVFFVDTCGQKRLEYRSNPELHLGNEGFNGSIHSNLAIILSL